MIIFNRSYGRDSNRVLLSKFKNRLNLIKLII